MKRSESPGVSHDYTIEFRRAMRNYLPTRGLSLMESCRWSDRMLVTAILLMVFLRGSSLAERFAEARGALVRMYVSRKRPGKSYVGFMARLVRHSPRLLELVSGSLRGHVERVAGRNWKIGRHLAFSADGTKIDAKRTRANRRHLKIGGKKKSGPQQLMVSLMHMGTELLWSFRRDCANGSERALLTAQLELLPPACLLLTDAGFVGYEVMLKILLSGRHFLMRAGANVKLLQKLGCRVREKGNLVYLWPRDCRDREPLILRRIVLVNGRNRRMCLLTSLLEASELTEKEARELYKRRWGIELFFRGLKQTLGRRKMHSGSPACARVELDWTMAGYWMLGLMSWENRSGKQRLAVSQGVAFGLAMARCAIANRGDKRGSWKGKWRKFKADGYERRGPKHSKDWPHKKKDRPCGMPKLRMATKLEVKLAKAIMMRKQAA